MNKRTKKALLDSIEHWHQNLDMLILNDLSNHADLWEDIQFDGAHCPLCQLLQDMFCDNCPIHLAGAPGCVNTPWSAVRSFQRVQDFPKVYKVISDELEYLYSLLDD
jgi:hypothetical protein